MVSVWVLKILYSVIGMLYRLATFQDLMLTIQVRFKLAKSTNFTLASIWLYRKIGVSTSSQNLIHFEIRYHRENIWVLQLNIADSKKKNNSILCVAEKELNFSGQVWCEQYEPKKSTLSHKTKVKFRPLAVNHIFHNTDT